MWVDIFIRSVYADLSIESPTFCITEKGLCNHTWVLMPNHLHTIISTKEGFILSDINRDFKKVYRRGNLGRIGKIQSGIKKKLVALAFQKCWFSKFEK